MSFVYGPCGREGVWWSVNVLTTSGDMFEKPYLANSLEHAVEIAIKECKERNWLSMFSIDRN